MHRLSQIGKVLRYVLHAVMECIVCSVAPARGGKCSDGGIVPDTAFIFRVFVATPWSLSYLYIFSSFYLALNILQGGE